MIKAAHIVSDILIAIKPHVVPGVNTFTLDCVIEEEIKKRGATSYNKGYHPEWARYPYPNVSCISVNDVIAHGIPSEKVILKEGDLVNIDLGIMDEDGNCGDSALTLPVGEIAKRDQMLLDYAKKTLYAGIERIKAGRKLCEIAWAMEHRAKERNFVINHQLCGHAIGKSMHEHPTIYQCMNPHYNDPEKFKEYQDIMDEELTTGQVICLEPMLTFKDEWGVVDPQTGWEVRTRDGQKSAMFESMILVKEDGHEILTHHI